MTTESWPLVETIANKVKLADCMSICKETLDLYGYKQPAFAAAYTRHVFAAFGQHAYPNGHEMCEAVSVLQQRVESLLSH
jgi:hypothetical protein